MTTRPPFHLAIPVDDLAAARRFYGEVLGLDEGRSAERWVDWDFHGHQLVTHVTDDAGPRPPAHNPVDGHAIPVPHFGVVLTVDAFHELAARLRQHGLEFVVEPYERFAGEPGEQWTMFFLDPAGNAVEVKAFRNEDQLFAT